MIDQPLRPPLNKPVTLKDYDPDYTGGVTKDAARQELDKLQVEIALRQEMLYAQGKFALLIVLQGMDTSGKDGTVKKVFEEVNPLGVRVASFKTPTPLELSHDFLWRIHQQTPPKGYIGIFNRSHYEDVLIVRVENLVPQAVWEQRYEQINQFEAMLSANGTRILKFFLHISKAEQKKRLQERLDDPEKHWKFSLGDLPVRAKWDEYMRAYEAVLTRCNTEAAPWHIIPANYKWYRDLVISRTIVNVMKELPLAFPPPEHDLSNVVIPD